MQNKSNNKEIKGYKILGKIAKGGMGELYKGIHPGLNKEIILKKLISKTATSFSERFKREAALMMEVSHPNVVHLFDFFREGNSSYIVMEYVPGYNLSEFIGKFGKLPVYLASYIAFEVAKGLEYAHSKGIIHRDIKPGNVLISMSGEIKLTDFGIAFKSSREDDITKTGTLLGTPSYMSPEQIYSSKDVDTRTDIYSLGVIFYEMITGIKPFSNQFSMENVVKIKKGKCPSIRSANKNVPPKLVRIIKKMMNPKKSKRYKTITEFINKIQPFIMNKFKDHAFLKASFNNLIIKQNPSHEINNFKYPGTLIILSRLFKCFLAAAVLLSIVLFIRFFYPGIFLSASFPDKYGIVELKIIDDENINDGHIEFYSQNGQYGKRIRISSSGKGLDMKNIILPSAKYTVYLHLHENVFVKEYPVFSYSKNKTNSLEFKIFPPEIGNISLFVKVTDVGNKEIQDYKLFIKKTGDNAWSEYNIETKIENGKPYDFSVYSEKYNVSIIKNIVIGKRQDELYLNFVLTEKKISVKFRSVDIPLMMNIDGLSTGLTDLDGINDEKLILTSDKEIFLTQGIHKIYLYNKERNVNSNFEFDLSNKQEYDISIGFDEDTRKLTIKKN
jgi:serine/threonine protein kinase